MDIFKKLFPPKLKIYSFTVYLFRRGITWPETFEEHISAYSLEEAHSEAARQHAAPGMFYTYNPVTDGLEIIEKDEI
jgi:hypothetical protein